MPQLVKQKGGEMFQPGEIVVLWHGDGKTRRGAAAEVVSEGEYPHLKEQLYEYADKKDGITRKNIDEEFIAVRWIRVAGMVKSEAEDGFYSKARFLTPEEYIKANTP